MEQEEAIQALYLNDHDRPADPLEHLHDVCRYGHLKYRHAPLFKVVVISWFIALGEYCLQVPANHVGSYEFTTAQLKTIQEVITLTVFSVFSVLYLKEQLRWNYFLGFAMMIGAVFVII